MMKRIGSSQGWLVGPASDLLWGAGLGYGLVFALLLVASGPMMSVFPTWLMMTLVVVVSMPHYGATILRVYESREDRRTYVLFAKYFTVLLVLLFVWGVRDLWVGSLLFTVYLTWSPWHYTGQNYGITLMFLGRRGVVLAPQTKLVLRVSYVASFVATLLFIHGPYTAFPFLGDRVQFLSLGLSAVAADLALFVALMVYGVSAAFVARALVPKGLKSIGPAVVLMAMQGLWFVVPAAIKNWLPYMGVPILTSSYDAYAFTWIALGHAAQYLWITAYFAKASGRTASTGGFYLKALLVGCALWSVPLILFAPGVLGKLPYDVGLASVVAAAVNLHHFVLDGAIWKLRDSRVAGILLRRASETSEPGRVASASPTARWIFAATGMASIAILLFGILQEEFGLGRGLAGRDLNRADLAMERLASIGRDSPSSRQRVGALALRQGDGESAVHHLRAGVDVYPTVSGWVRLGEALSEMGERRGAAEAFEGALAIDPFDETARMSLALAWVELGETKKARELLDAVRSRPETGASRRLRQRALERLRS